MGILQQYEEAVPAVPMVRSKRLYCNSQVVLGSPSTGCNGVGICKMYLKGRHSSLRCPVMAAWLMNSDTGRLRISFSKAAMEGRYLKRHFRWNLFQVLEAFDLPAWTRRKLELAQCRIEPGIYTVWETEEAFIVDF